MKFKSGEIILVFGETHDDGFFDVSHLARNMLNDCNCWKLSETVYLWFYPRNSWAGYIFICTKSRIFWLEYSREKLRIFFSKFARIKIWLENLTHFAFECIIYSDCLAKILVIFPVSRTFFRLYFFVFTVCKITAPY